MHRWKYDKPHGQWCSKRDGVGCPAPGNTFYCPFLNWAEEGQQTQGASRVEKAQAAPLAMAEHQQTDRSENTENVDLPSGNAGCDSLIMSWSLQKTFKAWIFSVATLDMNRGSFHNQKRTLRAWIFSVETSDVSCGSFHSHDRKPWFDAWSS